MRNNKIPYSSALPLEQSCSTGQPLHSGKGNFMKAEDWIKIKGYEDFEINRNGRIRNIVTHKKKLHYNNGNYFKVSFGAKKAAYLHRILAIAFIPNPENKREVNHIDGNKLNNALSNLEWATSKENIRHAFKNKLIIPCKGTHKPSNKLTEMQVKKIRREYLFGKNGYYRLAKKYDIGITTARNIINRKKWKHI
jgi:hypothetical protein